MNNFHYNKNLETVIILLFKVNHLLQEYRTITSPQQQTIDLLESIARFQDKDAFEELYWIFAPKIKSYMMQHGADDAVAEELAQEALMQVWLKADKYNSELALPSTWIFRIARNIYIDKLRRQKVFETDEINDVENELSQSPDYDQQIDAKRFSHFIESKLSKEQYQIVQLSYFKGLNQTEISDHLSIPLGTVKSRLRLAFDKLKLLLGGQNDY